MSTKFHIVEKNGKFLLIKTVNYMNHIGGEIVSEHATIDKALIALSEDGVPVNNAAVGTPSGGRLNVTNFDPLLSINKKKPLKRNPPVA